MSLEAAQKMNALGYHQAARDLCVQQKVSFGRLTVKPVPMTERVHSEKMFQSQEISPSAIAEMFGDLVTINRRCV